MGPMRAAHRFVSELRDSGLLRITERVRTDLYGSLALTGKGHGTDRAVLLGLSGEEARSIDPATIEPKLEAIRSTASLSLLRSKPIAFHEDQRSALSSRDHVSAGIGDTSSEWREIFRLRRTGRDTARTGLLLHWRRLHRLRRRSRSSGSGLGAVTSLSFHQRRRTTRDRSDPQSHHRRAVARQRKCAPQRRRGPLRSLPHLAGDAGLRRARA